MSVLNASTLWNRCLLASLAVNGVAVGTLGVSNLAHADASPSQKMAKTEKKPTRLMEIRMEKAEEITEDRGASGDEPGNDDADPAATTAGRRASAAAKAAKASARRKASETARAGKAVPNVDFGRLALSVPKPRTVHGPGGIIDLRNAHIKGTTYADPKLLAKDQPANRLIGKSEITVVGKATSLAQCIGAIGGNTIYGSKATILLGKGIDIQGTKFCAPGGGVPGTPGNGGSQSGSQGTLPASFWKSALLGSDGDLPGLKGGNGTSKRGDGDDAPGSGAGVGATPGRASGSVRNLEGPWVGYGYRPDPRKRGGGPETDLHLPARRDDPTDRVRTANRVSNELRSRTRFEPAPVSVGSHSAQGTIPWGPDSRKERPHGLKGDYYLGNEFERRLFSRVDRNVDFVWTDRVVDARLPRFHPYSVRWTGLLKADFSETYTIYATSDDGVRLWIDGKLVIDNWTEHAPQEQVVRVSLTAGRKVPIRVEYFEIDGLRIQVMKLYWESPSQPKAYIPARSLFQP